MQSLSIYFAFAALCGGALAWAAVSLDTQEVEAFYGFAETAETEINFNYPVEVEQILVQPGALVDSGQVLMRVRRAREKERLADQGFRIEGLRAEGAVTAAQLRRRLTDLTADYSADRVALENQRAEVSSESSYRKRLLDAVSDGDPVGGTSSTAYAPLDEEIAALDARLDLLERNYEERRRALLRELELADAPLDAERRRLTAERDFDEARASEMFDIVAPAAGLIGDVNAKIAEHKSSFSPLVIFYEPNPREVKAYIHEDRILQAEVGDSVVVTSITSPEVTRCGKIVGLGSRIVEIPARLRRMPDFRTYGREVIIDIPADNPFLQKEKVQLTFKEEWVD